MKSFLASLLLASSAFALPAMMGPDLATGKLVKWDSARTSVVVFLSPTCPCSQSHTPELAELSKEYSNVPFIGVVAGAGRSGMDAKAYFQANRLPFPVIAEPEYKWADAFGALNTPHAFIVDKNGTFLFQGGVDDSREAGRAKKHYLSDALEALAQGRPVSVAKARPLGCAIRQ